MAANLKKALSDEPVLKENYQRVNILVSTPNFTTMPASEFQREQAEELYRFVFSKQESCHVSYNVLRRSGMAILFGVDKNIHQMLLDDFPRARFYASASTLVEYFSEQSLGGNGRRMYAYLHERQAARHLSLQPREMSVYCFDQGKVLFANTYPVHAAADCQYYILAVWQQLGFDVCADTLCLVDDSDMGKIISQAISPYIQHIQTADRENDLEPQHYDRSRQSIPYDLHTLLSCGF